MGAINCTTRIARCLPEASFFCVMAAASVQSMVYHERTSCRNANTSVQHDVMLAYAAMQIRRRLCKLSGVP